MQLRDAKSRLGNATGSPLSAVPVDFLFLFEAGAAAAIATI